MTIIRRIGRMRKTADLIRQRVEEIARTLTVQQGKPLAEARLEALASAAFFES